ncbi:hypothetical protein M422DRAFT_239607 [Sphaerobolus stellatus SS14]|nr:hypothetical protein M422DRAFT_239607 [Sphaerobolus stellatus SS14]
MFLAESLNTRLPDSVFFFVDTKRVLIGYSCSAFNIFVAWGTVALVPIVDILIVMRIYAVYGQNRKVAICLGIMWLAEFVSLLVFIGVAFRGDYDLMPNPLPGVFPGCFSTKHPSLQMILRSGAIAMGFQAIYLALTLYKFFRRIRSFGWRLTPLLKVFFRDGAGYCLIIFVLYVFYVILFAAGSEKLQGMGEVWIVSTVAVTAGRLVLNIRDVAKSPPEESFETTEETELTDSGQYTTVIELQRESRQNSHVTE